jgi:hypothetical protein
VRSSSLAATPGVPSSYGGDGVGWVSHTLECLFVLRHATLREFCYQVDNKINRAYPLQTMSDQDRMDFTVDAPFGSYRIP